MREQNVLLTHIYIQFNYVIAVNDGLYSCLY